MELSGLVAGGIFLIVATVIFVIAVMYLESNKSG